jgi:small nuclear ribonucleoprotein (snRNP)-like protein
MSELDRVSDLLGKSIRVVISDKRVIEGTLQCMDKDLNFIIGDALEFHGVADGWCFIYLSLICFVLFVFNTFFFFC